MPAVAVQLLGGFAATVDGEPVPDTAWRLKKARELVKMLALAPDHQLHREQAMDALWGDRDPAAAANNLHQALHVVRRVLGTGTVVLRDGRLSLDSDIDVDRLHRAAGHAQRARTADAYHAALSLYRGPLLPENRYDDWAVERREELAGLHATLTRELAGLQSKGWAPHLPSDASSFIGRGRELAELTALLGHTRLLTLTGVGGAGKTRLALQLARGVEASFPDGATLVELAPLGASRLVPVAVAGALDVQAMPGRTLEGALADFVSARTMLLVLDNCEHVLGGCAPLADVLLRRAPGLTILATSREPLRVPGEVVFRVPSLGIPDPDQVLTPQRLLGYEAVQLLAERAAAALPGFEVTTHNAADLTRICFRLDGLPLALELAAARLATLGPAAVAERLDDRFRLLRAHSRVAPTRQQTLVATLDWSHDLLDADERVLFRRLAAFTGAFDLPEVEVVCSDPALDVPQIADLLGRLVDKSLVVRDRQAHDNPPYQLLETVRSYAQDRLSEAGELHELQRRHADWALRLAELEQGSPRLDAYAANLRTAFDTLLKTAPEDALRCCLALLPFWLRRIDLAAAHRRFSDALAGAAEPTPLHARALLAAAAIELRRGAYGQGIVYSRASLAIAVELADPRAQWDAVQLLGEFALVDDRAQDAERWLDRGLQIARREGMVAAEAIGIYSLGVARSIIDDLSGAEQHLASSTALLRTLAGSGERVRSPVNIGEMRGTRSDRPGLSLVFEETRKPFADLSCDAALGYVLANHASIARMRGDLSSARTLLDQSADVFVRTGNERGQVDVLVRRAYLCLAQGFLLAARTHLQEALARRQSANDGRGVGLVLGGLGLLETTTGDYPAAERHLTQACDLFRRAGDRWGLIGCLWRTADLAIARGRLQDAEAALTEALVVVNETGRERWIAQTLVAMAETAVLRGDTDRARTVFLDARERFALTQDLPAVTAVDERLRGLAEIR